ncbi:HTH-type transcriptional regulator gltC [Nocardia otitidiscaviarum]|uniref:HTH-type transcriptional regulator gltC n=1 Tax=Nocardia otitidiscaviarum TaxID=1823 RepID=A0A378Y6Y2_9NOCA|nr:LysR substrate-binding domain-containing protein [Nocardia otitidiscaviarum]MBF6238587.1 LysR family transcriptional regulator [Nocardia otitidiscaviarum]SUA72975.1 HTH-type transcriptional regulator gltC [Nocardia otitidiscaviarum]
MGSLDVRELEAFLALADELHFGRAGARLYLSQSRVSQLLRSLEQRVGATLVERTSRRVRLTPLGVAFLAELRPAYTALHAALDTVRAAARGMSGTVRLGFQGATNEHLVSAIALFTTRYPDCAIELTEIPLSDPFGAVYRHEVDAAVVLLPVREPEIVLGQVFSPQAVSVAVPSGHPFTRRARVAVEDLAATALIGVRGPAPDYWRAVQAPTTTPTGRPIPRGPAVGTLEEGLALVSAGRGALLLCDSTAEYHGRRPVRYVPVTGLPPSRLGLIWHRDRETARLQAFSQALAATAPADTAADRPAPPAP